MDRIIAPNVFDKVKAELEELDNAFIEVNGKQLKPSSCYYIGYNPPHILYNTNCPDSLKLHIEKILSKYTSFNESEL
ncbi:hypothetical protein [Ferruginibacter albus]|uniref:hypothetical protein n=1 Tax=Ferruginibacter albus TaxID=2875540 RepID=UPI001CC6AEBA|nr:hypothetical protein [Ferruginibacter albus]UAY51225.1 hypothetical protein K9M53_11560 [Ferruginibacter albus]